MQSRGKEEWLKPCLKKRQGIWQKREQPISLQMSECTLSHGAMRTASREKMENKCESALRRSSDKWWWNFRDRDNAWKSDAIMLLRYNLSIRMYTVSLKGNNNCLDLEDLQTSTENAKPSVENFDIWFKKKHFLSYLLLGEKMTRDRWHGSAQWLSWRH